MSQFNSTVLNLKIILPCTKYAFYVYIYECSYLHPSVPNYIEYKTKKSVRSATVIILFIPFFTSPLWHQIVNCIHHRKSAIQQQLQEKNANFQKKKIVKSDKKPRTINTFRLRMYLCSLFVLLGPFRIKWKEKSKKIIFNASQNSLQVTRRRYYAK